MTPTAYYNENDPFAAAWLRELIKAGLIMAGEVDERSIHDVQPQDLDGFTRCHFFAGIGGWDYALQLARWPADRPVWTGSCPCQPFSRMGKRKGRADERHLWPKFADLIRERKPPVVFGEQVASPDGYEWLDGVSVDLEAKGYAVGRADMCSAGVGAPQIGQRIYWVGEADGEGLEGYAGHVAVCGEAEAVGSDAQTSGSGTMPVRIWDAFDELPCEDGIRRVRPGSFPLAYGLPARVGRLRGFGNAIDPHLAAEFIGAYLDLSATQSPPNHPLLGDDRQRRQIAMTERM